mmetsp:Transcript_48040/g.104620  ORF Transcript_48040/g.104620 Transcript_48040/m.104620 type:complete len:226 (-) Transcript_48040:165-842(-)
MGASGGHPQAQAPKGGTPAPPSEARPSHGCLCAGNDEGEDIYEVSHLGLDECMPSSMVQRCYVEPISDVDYANVVLTQASIRGDLGEIHRALALGATVDNKVNMSITMGANSKAKIRAAMTPLMRAAANGHIEIVAALLKAGADPLKTDANRWTALCHALAAGELEAAHTLLRHPGTDANKQKVAVQRVSQRILIECEVDCAAKDFAKVQKEISAGGAFHTDAVV